MTELKLTYITIYVDRILFIRFCCSFAKLCLTLCNLTDCNTPAFTILHYLLEFGQTHVHWVWHYPSISSSVIPFSSCLQSFPVSGSFPMMKKSALCIRWPKYWSLSFSISPSKEYSGLISFRMDWLDVLAVQGTLKSLPQHHSSKASILRHSAFFIVLLLLLLLSHFSHVWLCVTP